MNLRESRSLCLALLNSPQHKKRTLLKRFYLLRRFAKYILPEYRFKWPNMDWWEDSELNEYLKRFGELDGNNTDGRYAVAQLLRLVCAVKGDTAEVGAYEGAMSWLICKANAGARMHHIFDSFEGLSQPSPVDGSHWSKGALACGEDVVHANLSEYSGHFITYKGWVPDKFVDLGNLRFSFVHIDVDLYKPTKESIEFFYPRMSPGGVTVCDDYRFSSCPGATKACDDYLADKPEKMIGLSAGAGFFIKGVETAAD